MRLVRSTTRAPAARERRAGEVETWRPNLLGGAARETLTPVSRTPALVSDSNDPDELPQLQVDDAERETRKDDSASPV